MKTINKNIEIFHTQKGAEKYFDICGVGTHLLEAKEGFFVEKNIINEEQSALKIWPQLYTLIKSK